MSQAKLSLSWDAHQKNICNGLSSLQQRGEFVDMTLAADGHHVKVHQMVLALVSPYIKDLISSAPCPHPVIFLNNISYTTLCEILEYVYTGEVLVPKEGLSDLIAAGRALHITGLKDMYEKDDSVPEQEILEDTLKPSQSLLVDKLKEYKEKKKCKKEDPPAVQPICKIFMDDVNKDEDEVMDEIDNTDNCITQDDDDDDKRNITNSSNVQFTVSTHGGLQIIYNRFIYHLRYIQKNRNRLWRCVDYSTTSKCPAKLVSNASNMVVKRSCNHTHPFHDGKILKKLRMGTIYSAFQDAENQAQAKKGERNVPITPPRHDYNDSDTQ